MAVERDSSYGAYAPSDMRKLAEDLRQKGIDVDDPLWTVGRLDEREAEGEAPEGNGNGNGNGAGEAVAAEPDDPAAGPAHQIDP